MTEAPFIGIHRHRLTTDGEGVTTLVGFWGCPLTCKYCLNPQSWKIKKCQTFTPQHLCNNVSIDQLYFLATGGGITFGGGEPLLYPDFINEFRSICGDDWNITLETSLNVPLKNLQKVCPSVNNYIVDIKDTNDEIYKKYTGKSNVQALENLSWLVKEVGQESIMVRVPLIPNYNTPEDIEKSIKLLEEKGLKKFDKFSYTIHNLDKKLKPQSEEADNETDVH